MKWEALFAPVGARRSVEHGTMRPFGLFPFVRALVAFLAVVTAAHAQTSGTWQAQDIGPVAAAGSSSASGGTFTVGGSGADIWGANDAFHFYAQTLTGDGSITARVTGVTNTSGWAKAGVMIRESLAANAANVFLTATPDWHGIVAQQRPSVSAETTQIQGPSVYPPYWLRLTRSGSDVTAATSPDGTTWTTLSSFTTTMGATVYLGLAVTSHNDGTLCTAQFDHLQLLTPPPPPTNLRVTHRGPNGAIDLAWDYSTSDVDRFEIRTNRQVAGDHEWRVVATVPGSARQATIQILSTDGAEVEIKAYRDFVRSPAATIWAQPTITPSLAITATTDHSVTLRITEQYGYGGGDQGPWSLERSSDGTNFVVIASGLTATGGAAYSAWADYTDDGLPAGATRHYRARALQPNGDSSAYSNVASATSTSPPPTGTWQSGDIGSVAQAGSDSALGNTVTVTGGGADIWDDADAFHFRYQMLSGDGSITARVVSVSEANVWSKAGVMIRNSLSASAPNAFAAVTPTWNGAVAQVRGTEGGQTSGSSLASDGRPPYWVRVARTGSIVKAQSSPDGITWNTGISWYLPLDANVFIGLAVTSHTQSALCTATFDHVTITTGSTPPPPPADAWAAADIGAVGVAGSNSASGNTITIDGSGADIWGTADAFRFVYQPRTGDGVIETQITAMDYTNGWAKAGVMIRESSDPGARNVFLAVTPDFHGVIVQWRSSAGAVTDQFAGPARNAPIWLRIARTGSVFIASWSSDGITWTQIYSVSGPFSSTAQWGFAVTAHDNTQLNHVVFEDPYIGAP